MEAKVIAKQDIGSWLKALSEKLEIIAPTIENGVSLYKKVEDPLSVSLDFPSPTDRGLKEHFTPETETLFEYRLEGLSAEVAPPEESANERVIFGARACDTAALKYIDAVYSMVEPRDELYFQRRERTYIVGVYCDKPSWSCFCTEVGDALTKPVNMDVLLTDIGEKYLAEALTAKGEELLEAPQFQTATDADKEAAETIRNNVVASLPKPVDHVSRAQSYDWDSGMWTKLAEKCLGCGACTYLCPTCHCFDIMECPQGKKGSRFRCWDTCQFEKFTLMGAGHNPRPSKKERTRQRVFHKFKYSPERYGMLGCVGCGRCIGMCPVNIDIKRVVAELEADLEKTAAE